MKTDVLVVGAGPAGSAAATWAAREGLEVALADAETFPRDKPCGDGLTPRAIAELDARLGRSETLNTASLRERYPELGFVFDRLEDYEEAHDDMVDRDELTYAEEQAERMQEALEECAQRFVQIRDMVERLAKFDAADPLIEELCALSNKADDGQVWADRQAGL